MNQVIMEFNALFDNLKRNWRSDENHATILDKALEIYRHNMKNVSNLPRIGTL